MPRRIARRFPPRIDRRSRCDHGVDAGSPYAGTRTRRRASAHGDPDCKGGGKALSTGVRLNARPGAVDDLLRDAVSRLTERDRFLLRMLDDHRVLTTAQVRDLGFASIRRAQDRLDQLHGLRLVDRFRPLRTTGSAPYHWVLDWLGAAVVLAERDPDADLAAMTWRKPRALAIARSQHLDHHVGANGFFTALIRTARAWEAQRPADGLLWWWSARRCDREFSDGWKPAPAHPDGACLWREGGELVLALVEWDCGTETLGRLADKLPGYGTLVAAEDVPGAAPVWVLFRFPSPRREAEARRALETPARQHRVRVATAVLASGDSPAEGVWLPVVESSRRRLRLVELAWITRDRRRRAASTSDRGAVA